MEYSIVIPVFNKAALTRHCLATIRPTLEGAGEGEIIVVDNASSDETPRMLAEFPWVRVVRNERNRGFAGANNQGARLARGKFLVLLNNDTEAHPGWLAAMLAVARESGVGAVGAKLLFPDGTLQHAGVGLGGLRFGACGFFAQHDHYKMPADCVAANTRTEMQCVTGACMVTPRELYLELGGLDEGFWNGYEDVDYCLRIAHAGYRVVYEPAAVLTHFESQSGVQRFRRVASNIRRLAERWDGRVHYDRAEHCAAVGMVQREYRKQGGIYGFEARRTPRTTIVVHGDDRAQRTIEGSGMLRACRAPVERILCVGEEEAVGVVRTEMERRGDRYLALVDARAQLREGWLDELVRQVEFSLNVGAATFAPELPLGEDVNPLAADARCTLLTLRNFPQHVRLDAFARLDAAIADLLLRAIELRVVTRGAGREVASLPPRAGDAEFWARHGMTIDGIDSTDPAVLERRLPARAPRERELVSIVMLSWNAPQFTKLALESIRAYTSQPYEVIVVDNGSGEETTSWLRTLHDVRVIYNERNRGFAAGCNQGIAAACGRYVVLLNNDVIVTEGWLDGLLAAFDRVPALGISAVRSNRVAGDQLVLGVPYGDIPGMHAFAASRRAAFRDQGYVTDRAIGLCLCVDRTVIDEIGGIDEHFGVGNFEDDDFCLRARAAGYRIYVCNDVFIHHFGSRTFAANGVAYDRTLRENWGTFARKWRLGALTDGGYDSKPAIARGFSRSEHYVPLPAEEPGEKARDRVRALEPEPVCERAYALVFAAVVAEERDWNEVGAFVRRYVQAFRSDDPVLLTIAAAGEPRAEMIGDRVGRTFARLGIDESVSPDVAVADVDDIDAWLRGIHGDDRRRVNDDARLWALPALERGSPSALRRLLGELATALS